MKQAIYLVMAMVMIASAMAIGITPGSVEIESGTHSFEIINNEHKEMNVILGLSGDLAKYVKLSVDHLNFTPADKSKSFSVSVNSSSITQPGEHTINLIATETAAGGNGLTARQAVIAKIIVVVPYPDSFAEAELAVVSGKDVNFVVKIKNRGKRIEQANARIEVYGATNEMLTTVTSDTKPIEPNEKRELVARYSGNALHQGKYLAKAVVVYDGQRIEIEKIFTIGELMINLDSIYVREFSLGDIAKFNIIVSSQWNEEVPVYADMLIKDSIGETSTKFTTASEDVQPFSTAVLTAFWDTKNVDIGTYEATVTLHFLGRNFEKKAMLDVHEDSIGVGLMPTGHAISLAPVKDTSQAYIIIIVGISVLINIIILIIFLRRKK